MRKQALGPRLVVAAGPILGPYCAFLKPGDVRIPGRDHACGILDAILDRRASPRDVLPPMSFGVSIRKRKTTGEMMIISWHVLVPPITAWRGRKARHIGQVIAPIDTVFALIKKNPGL